jgi:hypothetical protein
MTADSTFFLSNNKSIDKLTRRILWHVTLYTGTGTAEVFVGNWYRQKPRLDFGVPRTVHTVKIHVYLKFLSSQIVYE